MATYDDLERSQEDGRPIEYYRFILGGTAWYYTTADHNHSFLDIEWIAAAISTDSIKQTGEYISDVLTIECPSWIAPAQLFMTAAPSYPISIAIGYRHVDSNEIVIGYMGEIQQVNFPMPGKARLSCESLMSTMSREGLRLGWQRSCPYALYDPLTCKVDKTAWKTDLTVLSIDGFTIDVELATTRADGYYDGGFIEWSHPIRGLEFLFIESHTQITGESNARIVLSGPPGELYEGATGSAYPGCNFTPANCTTFANYDNYGGVPDMPGKSPFDGSPVF